MKKINGNCMKCGRGNIIWDQISNVETDSGNVTCVINGKCEDCDTPHYAAVSGDIEMEGN